MSMKPFCNIRYLYDFLYYIIIVTWMLQFSYHQKRMVILMEVAVCLFEISTLCTPVLSGRLDFKSSISSTELLCSLARSDVICPNQH